jgi:hypothetical protein
MLTALAHCRITAALGAVLLVTFVRWLGRGFAR